MSRHHPLFAAYPLDGHFRLGDETLTTPYHVYDGAMLMLGGHADAAAASALLAPEGLVPLLDSAGRALMAVWVADFTDANLGPHHELQFSLFGVRQPAAPVAGGPYALYRAFTAVPGMRMVCHGLWNSTPRVVRFNAEHLKLDARLSRSEIRFGDGRWRFRIDDADGSPLAEGDIGIPARQAGAPLWGIMRAAGWQGMLRSMRARFVQVPVRNTHSAHAQGGWVAQTATASAHQRIHPVRPGDRLAIRHPRYAALGFTPTVAQAIEGVRFVYLRPQPDAG